MSLHAEHRPAPQAIDGHLFEQRTDALEQVGQPARGEGGDLIDHIQKRKQRVGRDQTPSDSGQRGQKRVGRATIGVRSVPAHASNFGPLASSTAICLSRVMHVRT